MMIEKKQFFILLALCVAGCALWPIPSYAQGASSITKKQASSYVQRNREAVVEYRCGAGPVATCLVVCSSGGNAYINAKHVVKAFYGERRSHVNGSVTGYYLAVDVDEKSGGQDLWATLQLESSCLFKGMAPVI